MIKKIKFTANNQTLKGTLVFPKTIKSKLPAILLVHGWTSSEKNYIPRAQALSKLGYICLTFNLRGYGSSEGKLEQLSRQDHLQDVIAAYDFLISQKGVDKKQVGVIGSSYGGYMASLLTAKRKIKWLVLRAPALYPDSTYTLPSEKIKRTDSLEYFKTKVSKVNNKALKSLSKYTGDLLMIESGKDEFIPHQTIQNYINTINPKASFNHIIIKGADHALSKHTNNKKYLNEFIAILQDHFLSKLSLFTEKKVITINTAKEKLLGIKTIPNIKKQKYPCVVLVHGFGVTKHESGMFDNIASYLAEAGIVSFRFDFSGCGESEGDYSKTSLTKLKNDLAQIIKFIKKDKKVDVNRFGILAQSFGTATTIALIPKLKTLMLMGSFVDGYKALKDGMTKFNPKGISYRIRANGQKTYIGPQFWQELKKYTLPKLIQSFNCPILFIHGAKDETIPLAQMLALYKSVNQPKKKIILRGADHGLRPCRSQMNKIMVDWFSKKL